MPALVLVLLSSALALGDVAPAVPLLISHAGRLLDANDQPVTADVDATFNLYDTDDGSQKSALWSQRSTLQVRNGTYAIELGATVPFDPTVLDAAPALWFSVTIAGNELLPRERLSSTPYAMRAARAAEAQHVLANGVDTAALQDGAITTEKIAAGSVTLDRLALDNGKLAGLDADTLDGLDSSAFAPASDVSTLLARLGTPANGTISNEIEGVADQATELETDHDNLLSDTATLKTTTAAIRTDTSAIRATLGSSTSGVVLDLATTKGNTTSLLADTASIKSSESAIAATLGSASGGIVADLAAVKGATSGRDYSWTCQDFAAHGWPSQLACVRDGRVHLVYANDSATPGSPATMLGVTFTTADRDVLVNAIREGARVSVGEGSSGHRADCVDVAVWNWTGTTYTTAAPGSGWPASGGNATAVCSTAIRIFGDWNKLDNTYGEFNKYYSDGGREYQHFHNFTSGTHTMVQTGNIYRWYVTY